MAFSNTADIFVYSADAVGDRIVFGTVALGTSYGQVVNASLARGADEELIKNNKGSIRAALFKAPSLELEFEVIFSEGITLPGLMDAIVFPLAGVTGRITKVTPTWGDDEVRKAKITAKNWDSLTGGTVTAYNGATHTPLS